MVVINFQVWSVIMSDRARSIEVLLSGLANLYPLMRMLDVWKVSRCLILLGE